MIYDDYYDNPDILSERVILSSDLIIDINNIQPTIGKFYIPILTPTLKMDKEYNKTVTPPLSKSNIHGDRLVTKSYISSNYIELEIPVYIIEQFIYLKLNPNNKFNKIKESLEPLSKSNEVVTVDTIKNILINIYNYLDNDTNIIIPKDTEFIITGIGASNEYEDIRIIGIYTSSFENVEEAK